MTKRIFIYPKLVANVTVPDAFDEADWYDEYSLTIMRAIRDRLRDAVIDRPGVTYVGVHIHHGSGGMDCHDE